MKFVCKDCGYTCEGDSAPDECPCCHKNYHERRDPFVAAK